MSSAEFEALYNSIADRDEGWEVDLVAAWGCLNQDQKDQLDAIP